MTIGMPWRLALLAFVACGSKPPPAPPVAPAPAAQVETGLLPAVQVRGEDAHESLEARMRELKIPAISIAVFDHYELVWAKAYGMADVQAGVRADEHTTFLAGSISKSVNALAQLMAAKDGLLALDTPINDSLESWKLPDNELTRATPVTLRMLLSHTAGTTVHGFRGYAAGEQVPTVQQILDGVAPANSSPIRVDLAPGSKFRYSGGGITISQLALAERSKKPYPQVLAERVLGPLGMTDSSFDQTLTPERLKHAAVGYGSGGDAVDGKRFVYPEMAAAGLWTTPSDLGRFFLEIAKARAGRSTKIDKAIALQMTTKVIDVSPGQGVGLGVFLMTRNGAAYFGHGGADIGFQADALASLDGGRGIVIMTNSENGLELAPAIERTIMAAYGWPGAVTPITRVALDPALRTKVVGRYLPPYEIVERDGKLFGHPPFMKSYELVPTAADTLVDTLDGSELHLAQDGLRRGMHGGPSGVMARADGDRPLFLLEDGRFDDAVAALKRARDALEAEVFINELGIRLLVTDSMQAALVFRLNAAAFPDSANVHDSYGEALGNLGKLADAIAEYQRALELVDADARIPAAEKPLFRAHAQDALTRLRQRQAPH